MKILTTYLRPTRGTATVCGFDVSAQPLQVRSRIGYLPENLPLYLQMETGEYLEFVARARGLSGARLRERMEWVLTRTGLTPMYHRPIGELSKGYRQRTALAQALVHDPEVIILDEPTTGLDPHQILEIRGLIRELAAAKTVIFSTHILQEAEAVADRVVIISQGAIKAQGTIDELALRAGAAARGMADIRHPFAGIAPVLRAAGFNDPELDRETDGWCRVRFTSPNPATGMEAVSALCAANAWPLRELNMPAADLESIFLALTQAERTA